MTTPKRAACALIAVTLAFADAAAAEREPPFAQHLMDKLFDAAVDPDIDQKRGYPSQLLTMAGREDIVLHARKEPPRTCTPLMNGGVPVAVLPTILERAATERLVMINEAHDDPQGRAFILDLLEPLRRVGFTHYAAETFRPDILPMQPAWPRLADGFYSQEPVFGQIIRRARTLQFEFVPYEIEEPAREGQPWQERFALRETAQAHHLVDRVLSQPQSRLFVHAGYAHINEEPTAQLDGTELRWMAARLKAESGLDPFTIDQTSAYSPIHVPVVCVLSEEARKQSNARSIDMIIAQPIVTFRAGRPAWRQARGEKLVAIPPQLRRNVWAVVEARIASEPDEAVPADRLLIGPDEHIPLVLAPGAYRVEAWTREKGWSKPVRVNVK